VTPLLPLHLGALHPAETVLTLVLAFGPFLVLGAVIAVRRRHDRLEDEREAREQAREQAQRER
jgi:hypothetical protein